MKALGLLVRLLSRPDNWNTNSESLAREFGVGRDQVRNVLSELRDYGYMQLVKSQDEHGLWSTTWYVFDEPNDCPVSIQPTPENQDAGKPYSGESGANTRTDLTRTDNKRSVSSKPVDQSNPLFDKFWHNYPRKSNKAFARRVFDKLKVDEEMLGKMLSAISTQQTTIWKDKDPQYIPHPSTWLNGERWEDEIADNTVFDELRKQWA